MSKKINKFVGLSTGVGELMKKKKQILDERFDIERKKISQKKRFYV